MWCSRSITVFTFRSWLNPLLPKRQATDLCFLSHSHSCASAFRCVCCCWSWSPLSLCMKQQSKVFPWQRIRQETPSPLLPSPPLPPQLSAQTLLPKRERECVYFSASGLVAAPLWLDRELLLCREAKKQKRREGSNEGSIITLIALIISVLRGISTPF